MKCSFFRKNWHLPLIYKLCSKIHIFWNYLIKYPYFWNSILTKSSNRWNSTLIISSFTKNYTYNSILRVSNFTHNLILFKLNFKNKNILLSNFKIVISYYLICKLEINVNFLCILRVKMRENFSSYHTTSSPER